MKKSIIEKKKLTDLEVLKIVREWYSKQNRYYEFTFRHHLNLCIKEEKDKLKSMRVYYEVGHNNSLVTNCSFYYFKVGSMRCTKECNCIKHNTKKQYVICAKQKGEQNGRK